MLKFLQNRTDQLPYRRSIRNKPHITFGISLQTPSQFQKQFTMFSTNTFVNPYIPIDQIRKKVIPTEKLNSVSPDWTRKLDISQIQEMRSVYRKNDEQGYKRSSRYVENYYKQLGKSQSRFRLTKGEFGDYLERNQTRLYFGPLQGKERTLDRSLETKRSIMEKSFMVLENSKEKLINDKKLRKEASKLLNKVIDEKYELRKQRKSLHKEFERDLVQRKSSKKFLFNLPKVLGKQQKISERDLFSLSTLTKYRTIDTSDLTIN